MYAFLLVQMGGMAGEKLKGTAEKAAEGVKAPFEKMMGRGGAKVGPDFSEIASLVVCDDHCCWHSLHQTKVCWILQLQTDPFISLV